MRPFDISGLNHMAVLVNNLDENLAFYEGVLGCTIDARLPEFGMVALNAGSDQIDLVDVSVPEGKWAQPKISGGSNVDHFALEIRCSDESAVRAFLASRGIDIDEVRVEEVESGRTVSLYVFDPSGNKVELLMRV